MFAVCLFRGQQYLTTKGILFCTKSRRCNRQEQNLFHVNEQYHSVNNMAGRKYLFA